MIKEYKRALRGGGRSQASSAVQAGNLKQIKQGEEGEESSLFKLSLSLGAGKAPQGSGVPLKELLLSTLGHVLPPVPRAVVSMWLLAASPSSQAPAQAPRAEQLLEAARALVRAVCREVCRHHGYLRVLFFSPVPRSLKVAAVFSHLLLSLLYLQLFVTWVPNSLPDTSASKWVQHKTALPSSADRRAWPSSPTWASPSSATRTCVPGKWARASLAASSARACLSPLAWC